MISSVSALAAGGSHSPGAQSIAAQRGSSWSDGGCCCCHRCCQALAVFKIAVASLRIEAVTCSVADPRAC